MVVIYLLDANGNITGLELNEIKSRFLPIN